MASSANFTLDDSEEADVTQIPVSSAVPVAQAPPQPPPATARPSSPIPSLGSPIGLVTNVRDTPKAHVDTDLGVSNLAQAAHALQENQKRIEETESLLQGLMRHQARLVAAGRLLEQQKVLDAVATGPELGYDTGRPIAALLVYRCCLRWGCFTGDSQASVVLDNLSALLLTCTDEDAIAARAAVAARAQAGSSGGGAGVGSGLLLEEGSQAEHEAVAAATREVAYWLSVTAILLALVDPHLPLTALSARSAAGSGEPHAQPHHPTPLAVVAGDARASMARAASAAAAKVQELQKRMGNTLSGMQLLGKNLLMRRRASSASKGGSGAGAAPAGAGAGAGTDGGDAAAAHEQGQGQGQEHQRQSSGAMDEPAADAEAAAEAHSSPPAAGFNGSSASVRSPSPSAGGPPEQHPPASVPLPAAASVSPPPGGAAAAAAGPSAHSPQAFRQQLDLIVQKTYLQMRDSLKRHVSAVLPACVQQPLAVFSPRRPGELSEGPGAAAAAGGGLPSISDAGGSAGSSAGGAASSPPASSLQAWTDLIAVLSEHLALLREAHVPRILIRCLFKQTLAFIDVQLFNQLLLRPECCCTSNARYLVAGLQLLDAWLAGSVPPPLSGAAAGAGGAAEAGAGAEGGGQAPDGPSPASPGRLSSTGQVPGSGSRPVVAAGEELAVLAENLRHIRQASHFLILANKGALKLDDFTAMCPALNVQQLYRLATTFWDDSPLPPPPPTAPAAPQSPSRAASPPAEPPAAAAAGTLEAEPEAPATSETAKDEQAREKEEAEPAATQEGETATQGEGAGAADLEAAAEAAVAAAAAAAAADEADASAPPPPPLSPEAAAAAAAVSRNVSGEVLEEMKRRHSLVNNGGLIVTFLLDEDSAPLIVQGGAGATGAVARQLLHIINEPKLHEGLHGGLPPALCGEDCPPAAFAFMLLESLAPSASS